MTNSVPVPDAALELRAGPLTLTFESGAVREVQLGNVVVLRGVYAAVRDQHWGTVAPKYSGFKLERRHLGFSLSLSADYQRKDIDVRATIQVTGNARGQLVYAFSGQARSDFLRNRIGLCVLHPAGAAGAACQVERIDGVRLGTHFPSEIIATQPLPPFIDLGRLTHQVAPGVRARVTFEGDLFETEDQRNWTDASFQDVLHTVEAALSGTGAGGRYGGAARHSGIGRRITDFAGPSPQDCDGQYSGHGFGFARSGRQCSRSPDVRPD